jgi:Domain of unknown function (DUF4783)
MKKFLFFFSLILAATVQAVPVSTVSVHGQLGQGNPVIEAITRALNAADADALAQYFGAKVQISIGDDEQTLDKAKATDALKAFFATNKPAGYASMHSGKSKENSDQYTIGNLNTGTGTYRVYIYLKTSGSTQTIQEIRFDKGD